MAPDTAQYFECQSISSPLSVWYEILSSVNLHDRPIRIILAIHLALFLFILHFRNTSTVLGLILFLLFLPIAGIGAINKYQQNNWQRLGFSQDYFDDTCCFTALVLGLPLVALAVLCLVLMINDTCRAVDVRRYFDNLKLKLQREHL